ncbi:hypothetical protein C8Q73DRAFT_768614, partial [Cubamyces lactineus]
PLWRTLWRSSGHRAAHGPRRCITTSSTPFQPVCTSSPTSAASPPTLLLDICPVPGSFLSRRSIEAADRTTVAAWSPSSQSPSCF